MACSLEYYTSEPHIPVRRFDVEEETVTTAMVYGVVRGIDSGLDFFPVYLYLHIKHTECMATKTPAFLLSKVAVLSLYYLEKNVSSIKS